MSASAFGTLTAARDLEAAGFDKRQAEAVATAIRSGHGDLATKSDIVAVRSEISAVRSEIAAVRSELGIMRWVLGIQAAVILATFGIVAAKLL